MYYDVPDALCDTLSEHLHMLYDDDFLSCLMITGPIDKYAVNEWCMWLHIALDAFILSHLTMSFHYSYNPNF